MAKNLYTLSDSQKKRIQKRVEIRSAQCREHYWTLEDIEAEILRDTPGFENAMREATTLVCSWIRHPSKSLLASVCSAIFEDQARRHERSFEAGNKFLDSIAMLSSCRGEAKGRRNRASANAEPEFTKETLLASVQDG